jgi:hypothetical protein
MFKLLLTRELANKLAEHDQNYYARCIRGNWCVWDEVSDHAVEFDLAALKAAAVELNGE